MTVVGDVIDEILGPKSGLPLGNSRAVDAAATVEDSIPLASFISKLVQLIPISILALLLVSTLTLHVLKRVDVRSRMS